MTTNNKDINQVIFFDGFCQLCDSAVLFVIKHDKKNQFKFASLQSEIAKKMREEKNLKISPENETLLYLENNTFYKKSVAVLKISKKLNFPYFLLYFFILLPPSFRDFVYDLIAKNRYRWFGKKKECMIPNEELKGRFL